MTTLVALIGPPGAGKTSLRPHWPHATVVSLDDNRRTLGCCSNNQDPTLRAHAVHMAHTTTREALRAGRTVLWDATNAERADRAALPVAHVVLPPLAEVLARNARRPATPCFCSYARRVPTTVVEAMHDAITRAVPTLADEGWTLR